MNSEIGDRTNIVGTYYICGSCGKEQEIRPQDIIVCTDCSGRIFFKKRGNSSSQYEAR